MMGRDVMRRSTYRVGYWPYWVLVLLFTSRVICQALSTVSLRALSNRELKQYKQVYAEL
jgi:uncharacterized DUF497 family protein